MTLRDEILARNFDLTSRDCQTIADVLSIGRVRVVKTEVGKGIIIDTIGLTAANPVLDYIDNTPTYRHVKQLLENGWFDIGSDLARASLDAFVPTLLTREEADKLKALAEVPNPISAREVAIAIYNDDGSLI